MNYAPYNYDSFNRWRGNSGDSVPVFGATVPANLGERASNWFNGKTTLFTPSAFDAANQSKVQYQSQSHQLAPMNLPSLSSLSAKQPALYGKLQEYMPYNTLGQDLQLGVDAMTPKARAGRAMRRKRVPRRRRLRRSRVAGR